MMRYKYCAFLAAAAVLTTSCAEKKVESAAPPPPDVEVVGVTPQDVPITREWVGTLKGLVNAEIRSQVAGYVVRQVYTNGALVKKGDVLFEIDSRPFQATVDQATANLQTARAALQQARAALEQAQAAQSEAKANQVKAEADQGKTQIDVQRYTPLAAAKAISQQELDNAVQANLAAKAQVEAMKAAVQTATSNIAAQNANITAQESMIAASQAALENARLNLGFAKVTSLIDGIAGIATAQVGDSVGPQSPTALTTVSTVDPILVQFAVAEQAYLNAVNAYGQAGAGVEAAMRAISFDLVLADGSLYPHKGRLQFLDREVDVRTGSINVQAAFPNPNALLRPGGYATVRAVVQTQRGALTVPQRAVTELQGRFTVGVVGSDGKVSLREVKTGDKVGSVWVITEGLKAGENVVAEGTQKIREGMQVTPKPYKGESGKPGA
jgi:membrane fusion protein (multidrug efflux system)